MLTTLEPELLLVRVTSAGHRAREVDPLPMAASQPGCVMRRLMAERLAACGRAA